MALVHAPYCVMVENTGAGRGDDGSIKHIDMAAVVEVVWLRKEA